MHFGKVNFDPLPVLSRSCDCNYDSETYNSPVLCVIDRIEINISLKNTPIKYERTCICINSVKLLLALSIFHPFGLSFKLFNSLESDFKNSFSLSVMIPNAFFLWVCTKDLKVFSPSHFSGEVGIRDFVSKEKILVICKTMQRSGAETIGTQTQPSKPKREITIITNKQNTKRTYGQPSEQLFPKRRPLISPNRTEYNINTRKVKRHRNYDTKTGNRETQQNNLLETVRNELLGALN